MKMKGRIYMFVQRILFFRLISEKFERTLRSCRFVDRTGEVMRIWVVDLGCGRSCGVVSHSIVPIPNSRKREKPKIIKRYFTVSLTLTIVKILRGIYFSCHIVLLVLGNFSFINAFRSIKDWSSV